MPTRFLSAEQINRLSHFPKALSQEEISSHFTLSEEDLTFVCSRRTAPNRLGIALQLCTLRYLGFVPVDLRDAPEEVVDWLAKQPGER